MVGADTLFRPPRLLGFAVVVLVLVSDAPQVDGQARADSSSLPPCPQASPPPPYADEATAERTSTDRVKLVAVTTPLLLLSSFFAYYSTLGSLASLMAIGMGVLGLFGAWVVRLRRLQKARRLAADAIDPLAVHVLRREAIAVQNDAR